jgi:hypothetical protein
MSDAGEIEVEAGSYQVLPKDVVAEMGSIKLFNKWLVILEDLRHKTPQEETTADLMCIQVLRGC